MFVKTSFSSILCPAVDIMYFIRSFNIKYSYPLYTSSWIFEKVAPEDLYGHFHRNVAEAKLL